MILDIVSTLSQVAPDIKRGIYLFHVSRKAFILLRSECKPPGCVHRLWHKLRIRILSFRSQRCYVHHQNRAQRHPGWKTFTEFRLLKPGQIEHLRNVVSINSFVSLVFSYPDKSVDTPSCYSESLRQRHTRSLFLRSQRCCVRYRSHSQ